MLSRKRVLLAKKEVSYGQDSTPTGAANAILVSDLNVVPLDIIGRERDNVRETLGNNQVIVAGQTVRCSFAVEVAGSGTAGTAPAYAPLLEACGFEETLNPGVSAEYDLGTAPASLSLYYNLDGVKHAVLGARGSRLGIRFANLDIGKLLFEFMGLYVPVTDATLPTQTLTAWKQPVAFNNEHTSGFSLHGYAAGKLHSLELDLGLQTVYRNVVGEESVQITDRKPSGSLVMDAVTVATKDWWALAKAATLGALALTHGSVAGNKFQLDAPKVQILRPGYGDADGVATFNTGLGLNPDVGNDELKITVL